MGQEDFLVKYLTEVTKEFAKWLSASIKDQFMIYCCFNSNIRSLKDEANKLDDARATLQSQVDQAKNSTRVIVRQVDAWFEKTKQFQDEKERIESRIPTVQKGCLSIISRIPIAKEAKKTAESMKEHRAGCHFDPLSLSPPPEAAEVPELKEPTYEFGSRKKIEESVMEALRDGNVNLVGICGMGGTGKTHMAKKLRKRVMEEKQFDESVMVTVSQKVDIFGIQTKIAEQLGIKKFEELKSEGTRAHTLRKRVSGTKKILIVVDDIWKKLELEGELGISCGNDSKGCTVLLTSRTKDVLTQMNVKVFGMDILSESESWFLFRKTACVDDQSLVEIAKDVAKQCNRLPIAVVTIGSALKGQESHAWKDALDRLKSSNMQPEMKEELYARLRLSYDFLKDEEEKSLLLLCSLFPEDFDINLNHLALCSMELKIIRGISNLEQARNRVRTIADKLKSLFLLVDGYKEHTVKMHDLIRDMAIYISREIRLVDAQSGSRGHLDVDSKGILQAGGSDQSLEGNVIGNFMQPEGISWQSGKQFEDGIMEVMSDQSANMIGIVGLGGIGKTSMGRKLVQRGMEENLFDEIVMVIVGKISNMFEIQLGIAMHLGYEKDLRNLDTLQERANKLSSILGGTRRILIVFDDIWDRIELEDLGIPCGKDSKGCTVLLTSRSMMVLKQMNAKVFGMDILSESEAWSMFRKTAGACVDDPRLMEIAKEVSNECKGLPLAIVVVGKTLKDTVMPVWRDALHQLCSSKGHLWEDELFFLKILGCNLGDVTALGPLCLSYGNLRDPEAKSLYLLCSLFLDDPNINIEALVLYSLVFKIFGGINNVEQARNRVVTIAKMLKSCSLLWDGDRENHVKMHPMMRIVVFGYSR